MPRKSLRELVIVLTNTKTQYDLEKELKDE